VLSVFLLTNAEIDGDFEGILAAGFCATGFFTLGWAMVSLIAEYSSNNELLCSLKKAVDKKISLRQCWFRVVFCSLGI
jgi:hypothetical protein